MMVDVSIVTETSQEAKWNRQTGRRTGAQDHVLCQVDALTKNAKKLGRILHKACHPPPLDDIDFFEFQNVF